MVELVVVGFVAGIVAGISPCILPVLPVVLFAGATTPTQGQAGPVPGSSHSEAGVAPSGAGAVRSGAEVALRESERPFPPGGPPPAPGPSWWQVRARPVAVVAGLVVSFSFLILAGSEVLSALGLPQDLLRDVGIALLVLVGLGFLFPPLSRLLERPFARVGSRQPRGKASGFVVGLALGALFVPCAGPVLAAITVVGATHKVGPTAVLLTVAFAAGAAVPLLAVAIAGSELVDRVRLLRRQGPRIRQVGGVVLVVMALTIGLNAFDGLQRAVPGYTSALQDQIEGGSHVRSQLNALTHNRTAANATLADCQSGAASLQSCGPAPNFSKVTAWLNTPGGAPLSIAGLRGKVVLVDFWTYSCINCQRSLPHVEAWYRDYAKDGFVVVGVHTPEFSFEHVVSNVRTEAARLGVHYPIAIDDDYGTWDAYDNEYWPADYLIDARGDVRHVSFGEGDYSGTETLIRQLLRAARPGLVLPPPTTVPNRTPTGDQSPETYVGYDEEQYILNPRLTHNAEAVYRFPSTLPLGGLALSGTWTEGAQEATAGSDAQLELGFVAQDVYLVLGGSGTVQVALDHQHTQTLHVGGVPKLYTLLRAGSSTSGTLTLRVSPGVQAYDFTFG